MIFSKTEFVLFELLIDFSVLYAVNLIHLTYTANYFINSYWTYKKYNLHAISKLGHTLKFTLTSFRTKTKTAIMWSDINQSFFYLHKLNIVGKWVVCLVPVLLPSQNFASSWYIWTFTRNLRNRGCRVQKIAITSRKKMVPEKYLKIFLWNQRCERWQTSADFI